MGPRVMALLVGGPAGDRSSGRDREITVSILGAAGTQKITRGNGVTTLGLVYYRG